MTSLLMLAAEEITTGKGLGVAGAAIGMGLAVLGGGRGIGQIGGQATEAIARQPEAAGQVSTRHVAFRRL